MAVKTSIYDYANTITLGLTDRKGVEYGEVTYVVKNHTTTKKITPNSPGVWVIDAGAQPDTIDTGTGVADGTFTLTGGDGLDTFILRRGSTTVTDLGQGGNDILKVSAGASVSATAAGAWSASADTTNSGTAVINAAGYNIDLTAAGGPNGWTLTNSAAAAALKGSAQIDTITGGTGNDFITGNAGADNLNGANGNDTYLYANNIDFITGTAVVDNINDTGGTADKVEITGDIQITAAQSLARAAGVESLVAAPNAAEALAHSITINANDSLRDVRQIDLSASTHVGSSAEVNLTGVTVDVEIDGVANGSNTLMGGDGDDTLIGGSQVDTLQGGAGNDTYRFASSAAFITGTGVVDDISDASGTADRAEIAGAISIDASQSLERAAGLEELVAAPNAIDAELWHSIVIDSSDALQDIRRIDLSGSSQTDSVGQVVLAGVTLAMSIKGVSAGVNDLTGGLGDDTLEGGSGQDTFTGGAGNDSIILTEVTSVADQVVLYAQVGGGSDSESVYAVGAANDTGGDTLTDFSAGSDTVMVVATNVNTFVHGTHTAVGTADGDDDATAGAFVAQAGLISLDGNDTFNDAGDIALNFSTGLSKENFDNSLQYDLTGTTGSDLLGGGIHDDTIAAGDSDDFIFFAGGHDSINGGAGTNDTLLVRGGSSSNQAALSGVETVIAVVADNNMPVALDLMGSTGIEQFEARGSYSAGSLNLTGHSGVSITGVGGAFSQVLMQDFGIGDSNEETFRISVVDTVLTGDADTLNITLVNVGASPVEVPASTLDDNVLSDGYPSDESIPGEFAILDVVNDVGSSVIENYNITSGGGSDRGNFIKIDNTLAAKTLTISGDTDLRLSFNADSNNSLDGTGALQTVDASGLDGNLWLHGIGVGNGLTITGTQGNNDLTASMGNDTITTYGGDDLIESGRGNDTINAGDGNNQIRAGEGSNTITTGSGDDFIHAGGGDYQDWVTPETMDWVYDNTVNAGAGDDVVQVGVYLNEGDSVNGGEGNDTLWTDLSAVAEGIDRSAYMDGFEILRVGFDYRAASSNAIDMANYDSIQHLIYSNNLDHNTTVAGLASGATLEFWYRGNEFISSTVNLAGDTGSDVFNAVLNGNGYPAAQISTEYGASTSDYFDNGIDEHFGTLTIGAAETLNLSSFNRCQDGDVRDADGTTDGIDLSYIHYGFMIDAASLQTLNITGDVSVDLAGRALTSVTTVDAGTFTGDLAISMVGNSNAVTVTGGYGHDIITGGDGADVITGGAGGDILTGNAGDDTFAFGVGASGMPSDGTNTKAYDEVNGMTTLTIAGSFQEGDVVVASYSLFDTFRYTVQAGDSNEDIAFGLAAALERSDYLEGVSSNDSNVVTISYWGDIFTPGVAYAVTADEITDLSVGDQIDLTALEELDGLSVVWHTTDQATTFAGAGVTFTADYDVFVGSVGGQDYLFYETTAQGSTDADAGTLEVVLIDFVGTPANWTMDIGLLTVVA